MRYFALRMNTVQNGLHEANEVRANGASVNNAENFILNIQYC
jgi:hypothetical protein